MEGARPHKTVGAGDYVALMVLIRTLRNLDLTPEGP